MSFYRFTPGDELLYRQEFGLLASEDDEGEELFADVVLEQRVRVLEETAEGWRFQTVSRVVQAEGPLSENLPQTMRGESREFVMNAWGVVVGGAEASGVRWPVFPEDSVAAGDSWEVEEFISGSADDSKSLEYLVEAIQDGVLSLVVLSESVVEEEDDSEETQGAATFEFSLEQGHVLSSQSTLELNRESGVLFDVISKVTLQSRTAL